MKLAIIGNGFDVHHKMKTTFNDFRKYLNEGKNTELVNKIDQIINNQKQTKNDSPAWNEIENIFQEEFKKCGIKVQGVENQRKFLSLDELENIVESFVAELYDYMLKEVNKRDININDNIMRELKTTDVILSFNYTNTFEKYIDKEKIDVFQIHGSLNEEDYPIIGFFDETVSKKNATDYREKFENKILHKPMMAYKQNFKELDLDIEAFVDSYSHKIDEVVVIGYSFGDSDAHIYNILDRVMSEQEYERNIPFDEIQYLDKVRINIFDYNREETEKIISKIKKNLDDDFKRFSDIYTFGNGIKRKLVPIIVFERLEY